MRVRRSVAFLASCIFLSGFALPARQADVLIYGATASGVMAAYAAAGEGLQVILLEPQEHIGGMVTGGLAATDFVRSQVIGGYARNFYLEAAAQYGIHDLNTRAHWFSEPHVDETIFRAWLKKAGVETRFRARLREHGGVQKRGTHIETIATEDGQLWRAKIFIDCSYEGDLAAQAKVAYTVGREASSTYGETLAGVRPETSKHQFRWLISAQDERGHLLPEINDQPLKPAGSGDAKVQAYNFRLILSNRAENRLPWTRPEGYNPSTFKLLGLYLNQFEQHMGRPPALRDVMNPVLIPGGKADFNNNGPFSTDYIGKGWAYPDTGYAERTRIWRDHLLYTQSFLYFLSQDPQVPESLRTEMNQWGRARDEFSDTDHWPPQLYVREGRRMVGEYVLRQADLQADRTKYDSIGMGSYDIDSHNVQRVRMPDGSVKNESTLQVPVEPYEIPFRSILPKRSEADNLLVPVCLSASHVAYASVRMEPQYMILGQAAGTAAVLAVQKGSSVQDVPVEQLQQKLRSHGAILHGEQQVSSSSR